MQFFQMNCFNKSVVQRTPTFEKKKRHKDNPGGHSFGLAKFNNSYVALNLSTI